jgi:ubiquinone/menaquinone biosynthesis C-methylase UbiE
MELQPENTQSATDVPPQKAMQQMSLGYRVSRSIYAAAKLGIADLLKDGSKSCSELASSVGVDALRLYRLMRALASVGVFAEQEPGCFTLTPRAACLLSDVPGSMRALVIMSGEVHYQAWGDILYSLRTGGSAFEHLYGMPFFQYYAQNPEARKIVDAAMTNSASTEKFDFVARYDFSGIHKLVDVGGGQGSSIASILKANPNMQGVLFDLPSVIEGAKNFLEAQGVSQRCELVRGDFFESVPSGGDAYMLMRVIHDWDDLSALAILKNCHRAMVENGKLLVVEHVIPPGNESSLSKFADLTMMVMFPGACERTEPELRALFEDSGFRLTKIVPIRENVSLLEGIRM